MTPLLEAALELQNLFTRLEWRFCVIGGIALLRWGEPRFTRDVDVALLTGFGSEDDFIAPILASGYRGRIADPRGAGWRWVAMGWSHYDCKGRVGSREPGARDRGGRGWGLALLQ